MPSGEEIVPLALSHIAQMAEIEKLSFSQPWSSKMLEEEIYNPLARYLVYMHSETVIGYIGVHLVAGEGYITNVAVNPSSRGKGIGKYLMSTMEELARREKLQLLTLEVRKSNLSAQALYRWAGFEQVGVRPGYYEQPKEDAILMTLFFNQGLQER